jgi:hypothetical protein
MAVRKMQRLSNLICISLMRRRRLMRLRGARSRYRALITLFHKEIEMRIDCSSRSIKWKRRMSYYTQRLKVSRKRIRSIKRRY